MPRSAFFLFPLLLASLAASGCTPVGLAAGAGAAVATASQSERGLQGTAEDLAIRTEINHYLFQKDVDLFSAVSLSVKEGQVLLTGSVRTPEDRIEAARLAWQAKGIREVLNEIQVADSSGIADRAKDIWIKTRLEATLLFDEDVSSINYDIDTVNGTVYLFGRARTPAEQQRVIAHARGIDYVRNVVSYIQISDPS